jgi:hypothetical protein
MVVGDAGLAKCSPTGGGETSTPVGKVLKHSQLQKWPFT